LKRNIPCLHFYFLNLKGFKLRTASAKDGTDRAPSGLSAAKIYKNRRRAHSPADGAAFLCPL
ncbi:TPA: hypothetical protein ACFITY_002030, partial [Neisseria gonorrhoeae]